MAADSQPTAAVPTGRTPAVEKRTKLRPRRRWIALAVAILTLAAAAGGLGVYLQARSRRPPPVRYETAALGQGPISAKVRATGVLSAIVTVQVGSQVSGRIETLKADFNSNVKRGDVVATIEPSFFRAAVANARGGLAMASMEAERTKAKEDLAVKQAARAKALEHEGILPKMDLEVTESNVVTAKAERRTAQAAVTRAQAELDQALLNLKYTTIVSPIDGVVISRNVDVGQTVAATLQAPTLFTIAHDLANMQIDTNVAEADVGKIQAGMPVSFKVDAYPGRTFVGKVRQVRNAPQTIQNVVTYDAVIDFDNSEYLLKPGMTASVTFSYAEKDDVLHVSNAALRFRPDAKVLAALRGASEDRSEHLLQQDQRELWIMRGDRPELLVVRVGITDGSITEIVEGDVREGDRAVIEAAAL